MNTGPRANRKRKEKKKTKKLDSIKIDCAGHRKGKRGLSKSKVYTMLGGGTEVGRLLRVLSRPRECGLPPVSRPPL